MKLVVVAKTLQEALHGMLAPPNNFTHHQMNVKTKKN